VMSRGPQTFKQADVTRVLKAAAKAGFSVNRFEIDRAGKIVIIAGSPETTEEAGSSDADEWDSVE
jgi:hypothetical protein